MFTPKRAEDLIAKHHRSFITGDWCEFERQFDPDADFLGRHFLKGHACFQRYAMRFHGALVDVGSEILELEGQDDQVVFSARQWGRLCSPALGAARLGDVFVYSFRSLWSVRNNRIVSMRAETDKPLALARLGLSLN